MPMRHVPQRARFPVLDREPPSRRWRRLLGSAAVAVVAGAVAVVVAFWPFSARGPAGPRAAHYGGRIVAVARAGGLVLADPDGRHVIGVKALGSVGRMVSPSPDGRYLSLGNGQLAVVRKGPVIAAYASKVPLSSSTTTAWPYSFADHDRDLVMLLNYGGGSYSAKVPVAVDSVATGRSRSLGVADVAAGDPQAPGAFVSVAAPPRASATVIQGHVDSRVELRDAGRGSVVLATAAALRRDVGLSRSVPVVLVPYPDPAGSKVAVVVWPAVQAREAAGVVVLSRAGRVLGVARAGIRGALAWSPSGRSLAYVAVEARGPGLRVWTPGGRTATWRLPSADSNSSWCIWSPDSASVLCAPVTQPGSGDWALAGVAGRAPGGTMTAIHGPGWPVTWLPAGRGS